MANFQNGGKPRRVQRKRSKGWRMPENTVYVGRGSKWGNPYRAVSMGTHWTIVDRGVLREFKLTRREALKTVVSWYAESVANSWSRVPSREEIRTELRGKNLACWCPLEDAEGNRVPCHADVLLELANGEPS